MQSGIRNSLIALTLLLSLVWCSSLAASVQRSGSWFDPTHNGEGFVVQFINDSQAVVFWFTYDENGAQRWFTGLGTMSGNQLQIADLLITQGGVFGPGFDPDAVIRSSVGELNLTFNSDSAGRADYTINNVAGQQTIQRLTRPVEVSTSSEPNVPHKSGSWFDPTRDGEGFALEILPSGAQIAYWFTYDINGNQAWMIGNGSTSAALGSFSLDMLQPTGGRFGPDFDPDDVQIQPVGSTRLNVQCSGGFADYKTTDPTDFVDIRFDLQRIAGLGPGACNDPALVEIYPRTNGEVAIPDHEAGRQLQWFVNQLANNSAFSDAVIRQRFSDEWIAQNGIGGTRTILQNARSLYPSAVLTDPILMSPIQMTMLLTTPAGRDAFTRIAVNLSSGKITNLELFDYGFGLESIVAAEDRNLNLSQAADRFASFSAEPAVLVARINNNNQCQTIVGRNQNELRGIASVFKIWVLAGVAEALNDGALFHDQVIPLDAQKQVIGGALNTQAAGLPMTVDTLSSYMMGISDNTATDMMLAAAGRDRIDGLHAEYGHKTPKILAPQLGISEQNHLFFSFPESDVLSYLDGTEAFQRNFLNDRVVPLGAYQGGSFNNSDLVVSGYWQASAMDVCGAFARHRLHAPGSDAALLVERALQMGIAEPFVRKHWDRVWFKGGGLPSAAGGNVVLTYAFMLEKRGEQPIVVIAMANDEAGGLQQGPLLSPIRRMLELARNQ